MTTKSYVNIMAPHSRGGSMPFNLYSKSTPNLPTVGSFDGQNGEEYPTSPPPSATRPGPSPLSPVVNDGLSEAADAEDNQDATKESAAIDYSDSEHSGDEHELAPGTRPLYASRSYSHIPHSTATALYPPFYNRPPNPLPPSPSLTSLLRPAFSRPTSRPTTPDSSDVEASVRTGSHTNGTSTPTGTTNLANSARHAATVPRASPKVPTYEYYGFALYLGSSAAFLMYILWAYVPAPMLHQMGIHYYPNRWWALAVPCWLVVLVIYIYVALASYNTRYLTLPLSSLENLVDECAQVAVVDRSTGEIVRDPVMLTDKLHEKDKEKGTLASAAACRRSSSSFSAYQFSASSHVDWKSFWSTGTDAVMDVPIGGVCEILMLAAGYAGFGRHEFLLCPVSPRPETVVFARKSLLLPSVVALSALSMLAGAEAAETVLGAYIFHRHGDRTPKALAPTNLTALGYEQVYTSGQYYRSRYLSGDSKIYGINEDQVKLSQLQVQAPVDNVLQNSAMGFLQGLYPPVKTVQTLANGQNVQAPMDGYQLIPVNTIQTGTGSEDSSWLQDASSCQNAKTSSNSFFDSAEYKSLASSTKDFYSSVTLAINGVMSNDQVNYKNAYTVYDTLHVASIHNATTPTTPSNHTLTSLRLLADTHEWGLAYNASDPMRAVSGMQLAGEMLTYLSAIVSGPGAAADHKLGIQFGAYATFMSFFGLAGLDKASADFTGIVDYASSMALEVFTDEGVKQGSWPKEDAVKVRFLFHNGTATNESLPTVYPLFGGSDMAVSWGLFQEKVGEFAIKDTQTWCGKCGNTGGACAAYVNQNGADGSAAGVKQSRNSGISPTVGGVIGAMVTLAVVLASLAAVMLLGGLRLVSKKALAGRNAGAVEEVKA
ncbi:acid phosphatase [Pyrenophora seminiperda CCB06]|uniref:Acid phosphatase n=1 Tax=Pyrenophora seminiperda CCB06 TaxID=1302712 RepID=A0A3M7M5H6_9PLEO|nr:acid phosphatase [Pyrenophora seminiperda CCB06]